MKKILTLVYLLAEDRICLALKKRGFGEGNWNGFGGKVEEGERIEAAAVREVFEESEVRVEECHLEKVAVIEFFFKDGKHLEVHSFLIRTWEGEPQETEEMRPQWFALEHIPYERMWKDDPHWLPKALHGEKLKGKVYFTDDGVSIESMEWRNADYL